MLTAFWVILGVSLFLGYLFTVGFVYPRAYHFYLSRCQYTRHGGCEHEVGAVFTAIFFPVIGIILIGMSFGDVDRKSTKIRRQEQEIERQRENIERLERLAGIRE